MARATRLNSQYIWRWRAASGGSCEVIAQTARLGRAWLDIRFAPYRNRVEVDHSPDAPFDYFQFHSENY